MGSRTKDPAEAVGLSEPSEPWKPPGTWLVTARLSLANKCWLTAVLETVTVDGLIVLWITSSMLEVPPWNLTTLTLLATETAYTNSMSAASISSYKYINAKTQGIDHLADSIATHGPHAI